MKYKECLEYIRSDYYRISGRKNDSIIRMYISTFLDVGYRFMFWYRLSHWDSVFNFFPRILYRYISMKHHIDIERKTKIGYGFKILHGGPIVVNASATIGNNVNICQFSTIGSLVNNAAQIGDNVYIGPSVCIVENVSIGDNATIGAGSVVVKDVPMDSTVAGNPAKIISMKTPGRFVWKRWDMSWNK